MSNASLSRTLDIIGICNDEIAPLDEFNLTDDLIDKQVLSNVRHQYECKKKYIVDKMIRKLKTNVDREIAAEKQKCNETVASLKYKIERELNMLAGAVKFMTNEYERKLLLIKTLDVSYVKTVNDSKKSEHEKDYRGLYSDKIRHVKAISKRPKRTVYRCQLEAENSVKCGSSDNSDDEGFNYTNGECSKGTNDECFESTSGKSSKGTKNKCFGGADCVLKSMKIGYTLSKQVMPTEGISKIADEEDEEEQEDEDEEQEDDILRETYESSDDDYDNASCASAEFIIVKKRGPDDDDDDQSS